MKDTVRNIDSITLREVEVTVWVGVIHGSKEEVSVVLLSVFLIVIIRCVNIFAVVSSL